MNKNLLAALWVKDKHYTVDASTGAKVAYLSGFNVIFENVLNIVVALSGLAVFIMLVAGGIKYLTSGGDQKKAMQAKQTLTWAIVGLIALVGSWFILRFVSEFTGIEKILQFEIPKPST